ncbi:MAG TPA: homocysteine S-methyltransferase family protein [Burkholderiales bacterium]|nr:homocysteine S-methyltransferase family protein [Burkholderiales bacterium]
MARYRNALPQLGDKLFVTDGGIETTLMFHERIDLPYFAAFDVLNRPGGWMTLCRYYEQYAQLARDYELGLVLDSPTWRASADWGARLGYDAVQLADANRRSIQMLVQLRRALETPHTPMVVSGALGPRGDGYIVDRRMSARQAYGYHAAQVAAFAAADADMVAAYTINYADEAIGIVNAAYKHAMPVAISFTVETDGRLPSGETLAQAIDATDSETDGYAAYYMINCAHPTHFEHVLRDDAAWAWTARLRGVRANASTRSHAQLDAATDLDMGDPEKLARQYEALREVVPGLTVVGGCCGTDRRHIERIARAFSACALAAA